VLIRRDAKFLAALGVAPLALLAFWLTGKSLAPLDWPLDRPGRFIGLVLIWPVMEEVIFRGALQPALAGRPWGQRSLAGLTAANGVTSLIFAAAHFFSHPPLWAILVLIPSLIFGYFRDRHNSLLSPMVLHVAYNFGYYWLFSV
jgi:membrane protease YdiL (CAAX protease family)